MLHFWSYQSKGYFLHYKFPLHIDLSGYLVFLVFLGVVCIIVLLFFCGTVLLVLMCTLFIEPSLVLCKFLKEIGKNMYAFILKANGAGRCQILPSLPEVVKMALLVVGDLS